MPVGCGRSTEVGHRRSEASSRHGLAKWRESRRSFPATVPDARAGHCCWSHSKRVWPCREQSQWRTVRSTHRHTRSVCPIRALLCKFWPATSVRELFGPCRRAEKLPEAAVRKRHPTCKNTGPRLNDSAARRSVDLHLRQNYNAWNNANLFVSKRHHHHSDKRHIQQSATCSPQHKPHDTLSCTTGLRASKAVQRLPGCSRRKLVTS